MKRYHLWYSFSSPSSEDSYKNAIADRSFSAANMLETVPRMGAGCLLNLPARDNSQFQSDVGIQVSH